ncbi:quinone oxidoreductase family protein [Cohaesibacter celericrescens]|uniref:Quinone oxidoreductase n=1 Tax=Cohaesibacter celericrescens TaxID=2067669 RepID=A0A2N5XPW6_9HYPH|nr:quinone oxidoreductase [Cohaesibacter celericrescens]PLW76470.1 quinone oxidoreductase [Cohaesibacter celericrescens]
MTRIEIEAHGGPENMKLVERDIPDLLAGQVLVRHEAIGVNFIDTYMRTGLYPLPSFPSGLGGEAAGIVEAIGEGVDHMAVGDRVAYCSGPIGAYASHNVVSADTLILLPTSISAKKAAASMLKGLTVQYLIRQIYPVQAGETVLFHAAAGGVGSIAVQWLKALGATVIGTVGSEEKADLVRNLGCDHVINYRTESVPERVLEITGGAKVPVVFDGVGKDTFEGSLDCLRQRGLMISFGNASGPVEGVNLGILAAKGSLMVTRPTLAHFVATREALENASNDFFAVMSSGGVKIGAPIEYALADAAQAHIDLSGRKTTGSLVLIP